MSETKHKTKVIYIIAALLFLICIILHIIVNVKFQTFSVIGCGYYAACVLFIIFAFKPIKIFPLISGIIICAENIFTISVLYNLANEKVINMISEGFKNIKSTFEIFFVNC